jgi:D-inositol-3-phosphate glycosyltransferase
VRIGIVTHYWLPHRGGVEVMAREQALRLAQRGHEVRVVTSAIGERAGTTYERTAGRAVRVDRFPANDALGTRGVPWPLPGGALLRAWRALPSDVDVVIVHGCTYAHSAVVVEAARRAGTPSLVLQANPHVDYPTPLDQIERTVDRTLGRSVCTRADSVVSISDFTAAHVRRIAPAIRRHRVVYPGVDEQYWCVPDEPERTAARERLGVDGVVVLTVRRLVDRNGVDLLVDAWDRCGLDGTATLLVVGDGPRRAALEAAARGRRIRFLGNVDDDTVRAAYHAADLFVLPTRSGEGFGLAAAQAMSVGLPVVTTTGGAQQEVVLDGVTGAVVAPEPLSLGAAIAGYARDAAARSAAGLKARARVVESFTWDVSIDRLEDELLVLGSSGRSDGSRSGSTSPATRLVTHDRRPSRRRFGVSAIIVNYNSLQDTLQCVESLRGQDGLLEIIVVDNASSDRSVHTLAEHHLDVHLVASDTNLGFGGGVNAGARVADGDVLLVLNPDTRLDPGSVNALADHVRATGDLAGPVTEEGSLGHRKLGEQLDWLGMPKARTTSDERLFYLQGNAIAIDADLFDALGGFDKRLFLFVEDAELCWRARLAGHDLATVEAARIAHRGGGSIGGGYLGADGRTTSDLRFGMRERNTLTVFLACAPWWVLPIFVPAHVAKVLATSAYVAARGRRRLAVDLLHGLWWNVAQLEATRRRRASCAGVRSRTSVLTRHAARRLNALAIIKEDGVPRFV